MEISPLTYDPQLTKSLPNLHVHKDMNDTAIKKVAKDFESMVLSTFLQPMFKNSNSGMFGNSHGEKMFRSLLIDEYGKKISGSGGIGIADMVYKDLLSLQEESKK